MWLVIYLSFVCLGNVRAIGMLHPDRANQSLHITTTRGVVQGSEEITFNGETYFSYVGIPYAKPPVYNLRFMGPKRMISWPGILDATVKGPCCASIDIFELNRLKFVVVGEEDCLYLNVYTPRNPTESTAKEPLAVMVFFHGGAFYGGCANTYGPDFFMDNNVILVVPNFRLSIFGYLSTEDTECPGNWASKDHIAVLKWVQINISRFGGDPNRVTISGHSAGAVNVNVLLLSPKARKLFHRAILMSGSSLAFWGYQTEPRRIAFVVGKSLGIKTNSSKVLIKELRKVDSKSLANAQKVVLLESNMLTLSNGLPFTPTIEPPHNRALVTEYAHDLLESGNFNKIPIMAGVTSMEAIWLRRTLGLAKPFFLYYDLSPGSFFRMTKDFRKRRIAGIKIRNYFLNESGFSKAKEIDILKLFSEDGFWRPVQKMVSLMSKYVPVYFYHFSYEGQAGLTMINTFNEQSNPKRTIQGVGHSEDLGYIFTFEGVQLDERDMKVSKKLSKLYTNFAKFGNPTPVQDLLLDNVTWLPMEYDKFQYMNLDENFSRSDRFKEDSFRFWNSLYNSYAQKPYKVY